MYYKTDQHQKALEDANACIALDQRSFAGHHTRARVMYYLEFFNETIESLKVLQVIVESDASQFPFEKYQEKETFKSDLQWLRKQCMTRYLEAFELELSSFDGMWDKLSVDYVTRMTIFNNTVEAYFNANFEFESGKEYYLKFFYFMCCRYINNNRLNKHIGHESILKEMFMSITPLFTEMIYKHSLSKMRACTETLKKVAFEI